MFALLLAAQILQSGADTAGLMTPGVSRALATHRSAQIGDVRYALDLDLTRLDSARGHVRISFRLRTPGDVIVDFRGPKLRSAVVNDVASPDLDWNGSHLRIAQRFVKARTRGSSRRRPRPWFLGVQRTTRGPRC